ncbi:MAG: lactate utilization protein [Cloacibacillus sp.]
MDFQEAKKESAKNKALVLCRALEKKGYRAVFAADRDEAVKTALEMIPDGASVGIPGTLTVRELGLPEALEAKGCRVTHHWDPSFSAEERNAAFIAENLSDWVVTSTNAVTFDGTLVNIDGTGNRVAAMAWAPGKILYIIGVNKITPDLETAIKRVHNEATPPNALRLGRKTPCAATGICANCEGPNRICNILSIIEHAPGGRDCRVIVVGEELGY